MQTDFESVFERKFHSYLNCVEGLMHTGQRDMIRIRISKDTFNAGFRANHIGEVLYAKVKNEFAAVVDKCQVKIYTDAEKCTEKEIKQLRLKTSMVFQNYNIFKNKTVIENVMLPMTSVQKIEKEIAKEKALQYLDQVGLLDKVNEYPSRLSGGQQQRVGIARAMAVNPKLILLDEPTSSLDPELVLGILDILRNLANEHKRTMIIVTHEMSFAKEIADRIIFMDDGRIIEEGTPEEIFSNPQNERTKRFLERFQTF